MHTDKTIAAVSTAYGRGGVALIRISGKEAFAVASSLFTPKKIPFDKITPRRAVFGDICHQGRIIDSGLLTLFPASSSYTGEDTAEVSCHGGMLLTSLVLEAALDGGAVLADKGEFTFRALMNGRLSLSQAEAIPDLIDAQSVDKLRLSADNAGGAMEKRLADLRQRLTAVISSTYAFIDYPDEDLTELSVPDMTAILEELKQQTASLADSYRTGRAVCEGIKCTIAGRPNTGKSSLLNLLCGEEKAIVTDEAGTTRDVLEETVPLGRVLLRIRDTAGIRESDNRIEQAGIARAMDKIADASLVFFVLDASSPLTEEDERLASLLVTQGKEVIAVLNKSDLPGRIDKDRIRALFPRTVETAAKNGRGKEELAACVDELYNTAILDDGGEIVSTARLCAALRQASEDIAQAISALKEGFTQDIAALSLENALASLTDSTLRETADDIIQDIFSRFCIGK
ncbi:MAG: tRNA uridine-5-carboxymethylaminomethyl(34) synthesis GTPase MnmE [Ruminococcaceae bacterium]|nr:tRNA uridine-5-carboxymethylaminomethyl(34) synthesis GTPase MnmE [Oscillospiraceae bacterium]